MFSIEYVLHSFKCYLCLVSQAYSRIYPSRCSSCHLCHRSVHKTQLESN